MPVMEGCYSVAALVLALTNTVGDATRAVVFFKAGHWLAATGVLCVILCAGIASWLAVGVDRCNQVYRVDYIPIHKGIIMSFQWWIHLCHPYFQAGPQMILQLVLIWRGSHVDPVHLLFDDAYLWTWQWFEGVIIVCSLLLQCATLVSAFSHDNRERRPGAKLFSALASVISGVLLRSFILSMLCAIKPITALVTVIVAYIVNVILMKYLNRVGWTCFIDGYLSLLTPTGYARVLGTARRYLSTSSSSPWANAPEVERVKINQEQLCKNYKMCQAKFGTLTAMMMVTYVCSVEFYVMPFSFLGLGSDRLLPELKDRRFLYITPCALWLLNVVFTSWHLHHMKTARNAARTWHTLTPHKTAARVTSSAAAATPSRRLALSFSPVRRQQPTAAAANSLRSSIIRPSAPPPPLPAASTPPRDLSPTGQKLMLNGGGGAALAVSTPIAGAGGDAAVAPAGSTTLRKEPALGTYKFHRDDCVTCEMLTEGTTFRSTMSGKQYKFMPAVSCNDRSVIYLVTCANPKCSKQYVGKTEQELKQRHYGHRREIETKSSHLGKHFSESCGYTSFRIQIIDQIHETDAVKRKRELQRREGYWQHELMTFVPMGLNTRDEAAAASATPDKH